MADLRRVIDKFHGRKFQDLDANEQEEYMGAVAQRGAVEALKNIGLDDDHAISDIKDLRDLLKGVRAVRAFRHVAWMTGLRAAGKLLGYVVILWLAKTILTSPIAQKIADRIAP